MAAVARPTASFDAEAIERAEAALKALSVNFKEWMTQEVERLETARANARMAGFSNESLEKLYLRAHDVKGLGSTYEYPLITAVAAQLCRLLSAPEGKVAARETPTLIDAHVDAVRAILRADLRNGADPVVAALVEELKSRVDRWARE